MPYTQEQVQQLQAMMSRADMSGHPEHALAIRRAMSADTPFNEIVQAGDPEPVPSVRPTRKGAVPADPPPRMGTGSGAANWRAWIAAMADIDEEVAERMSRADIILFAEEENIIDSQPV